MDGGKTRLPLRWPQQETGKTAAFLIPSCPVDTYRTSKEAFAKRSVPAPS